jgi:hypothetical protein
MSIIALNHALNEALTHCTRYRRRVEIADESGDPEPADFPLHVVC